MTRKAKPSSAILEAQADAILRNADGHHQSIISKLEEIHQELIAPRNDPEYVKRLEEAADRRNEIANQTKAVYVMPHDGNTYLGITLVNPRDHAGALETAQALATHLEAPLKYQPDLQDATTSTDVGWAESRKPAHEFGREKRSLSK